MREFDYLIPTVPNDLAIQKSWFLKRALKTLGYTKEKKKFDVEDLIYDRGYNTEGIDPEEDDDEVLKRYSHPTMFPVKNGIVFKALSRIQTIKIYLAVSGSENYLCMLQYHPKDNDFHSDDIYTCLTNDKSVAIDLGVHRQTDNYIDDQEKQLQSQKHRTLIGNVKKASQVFIDKIILKEILPLEYHRMIGSGDEKDEIYIHAETVRHQTKGEYNYRSCIGCSFTKDINHTPKCIDIDLLHGFKSIKPVYAYNSPLYFPTQTGWETREIKFNPNTIGCIRIHHDECYIHDIQFFNRIEFMDMPDLPSISPNEFKTDDYCIFTKTDLSFYKDSENLIEEHDENCPYMVTYTDFMIELYDSFKGFDLKDCSWNKLMSLRLVTTKGRKTKFYGGFKRSDVYCARDEGWIADLTPPEGHEIIGVHGKVDTRQKRIYEFGITYAKLD